MRVLESCCPAVPLPTSLPLSSISLISSSIVMLINVGISTFGCIPGFAPLSPETVLSKSRQASPQELCLSELARRNMEGGVKVIHPCEKKTLLGLKYIPGGRDHISNGQTPLFSAILPVSEGSPLSLLKWLNVFTFAYILYQKHS